MQNQIFSLVPHLAIEYEASLWTVLDDPLVLDDSNTGEANHEDDETFGANHSSLV